MRDDICTIPVSEVFEKKCGCPLCRMYDTVEEHIINYIMGDAMMEPDVRIETNAVGFCPDHYDKMYSRRGRLQLALMLETHIKSIGEEIFEKKRLSSIKGGERSKEIIDSCFICSKIEWGFSRMMDTIYRCYEREADFRELFNSQPQFCLPHYQRLISGINKRNCKKHGAEMAENINRITGNYVKTLSEGISKYCTMYDYHNSANPDFGTSKDSVERVIAFLTAHGTD